MGRVLTVPGGWRGYGGLDLKSNCLILERNNAKLAVPRPFCFRGNACHPERLVDDG